MNKKYILIVSCSEDLSTNKVIDWIDYMGYEFIRINDTDVCKIEEVKINEKGVNFNIKIQHKILQFEEVKSYWYRRGAVNINTNQLSVECIDDEKYRLTLSVDNFLKKETETIIEFIHFQLQKIKSINKITDNQTNKLFNLTIANKVGLTTPDTIIATNKNHVVSFINKHQKIASKGIYESFAY